MLTMIYWLSEKVALAIMLCLAVLYLVGVCYISWFWPQYGVYVPCLFLFALAVGLITWKRKKCRRKKHV